MKNIFKSLMVCSMLCGGVMSVFGVRSGFVDDVDAVSDGSREVNERIQESVNFDKGETDEEIWKIVKAVEEVVDEFGALVKEVKQLPAEARERNEAMILKQSKKVKEVVNVLKDMNDEYKKMRNRYSELARMYNETLGAGQGKKCEEDTVDNDK